MKGSQTNPGQSLAQMKHNGYSISIFSTALLLLISLAAFSHLTNVGGLFGISTGACRILGALGG